MANKYKLVFNPQTGNLQRVLNDENLALKNHNHVISDVAGLQTILSQLTQNTNISLGGGYFSH